MGRGLRRLVLRNAANILTYGKRDRRWCQGNFQHFWLIFGDGVRFGHRLYFANGILAYTSGPLLRLPMTLGLAQGLRHHRQQPVFRVLASRCRSREVTAARQHRPTHSW